MLFNGRTFKGSHISPQSLLNNASVSYRITKAENAVDRALAGIEGYDVFLEGGRHNEKEVNKIKIKGIAVLNIHVDKQEISSNNSNGSLNGPHSPKSNIEETEVGETTENLNPIQLEIETEQSLVHIAVHANTPLNLILSPKDSALSLALFAYNKVDAKLRLEGKNELFINSSVWGGLSLCTKGRNIDAAIEAKHALHKGPFKEKLRAIPKKELSYKTLAHVAKNAEQVEGEIDLKALLIHKAAVKLTPAIQLEGPVEELVHGASAQPPDEEEIFYLETRGLSLRKARAELVKAFLSS